MWREPVFMHDASSGNVQPLRDELLPDAPGRDAERKCHARLHNVPTDLLNFRER